MHVFYIIRHAETLPDGTGNPPLGPFGIHQAEATGLWLASQDGIQEIWSSPFRRTVQTACIIADAVDLPVRLEPALHEWFFHEWFDLQTFRMESLSTIASAHPRIVFDHDIERWWPERNEDLNDLKDRMSKLANKLLNIQTPGGIVLVGHGASVATLIGSLIPTVIRAFTEVKNTSITEIRVENGISRAIRVLYTEHLSGLTRE